MKVRESGMPDRGMWEQFFDPGNIINTLGIHHATDVVEFGCGFGTFTIPAAKVIRGKIHALDIEPEMISTTNDAAAKHGLKNIVTVLRDFMAEGSGMEAQSLDYVMLFNILHLENPMALLVEANRILKKEGKIGIIHWNYDPQTPRGPSMAIRPKPEQCIAWAKTAGFIEPEQYDLKPYHYGIVMTKER